jgi:hypothetical protein|tara:strand:+ start:129 stop:422 length:294 start_codon:yes stop_codon:yes gene_type:complete
MITGIGAGADTFKVEVQTTSNRGWTPEEIAERAMDRILHISKDADEQLRAQALVFKDQIKNILVLHMKEAIKSDRTTICAELQKQGHAELANIIRKL